MKAKLLALMLAFLSVQANVVQAIPLSTLIDEAGTIQQGDKLFSNFSLDTFSAPGSGSGFSGPSSPAGIEVSGITINGDHGVQLSADFFATTRPMGVLCASCVGISWNAEMRYTVTVLGPLATISGYTLTADPSTSPTLFSARAFIFADIEGGGSLVASNGVSALPGSHNPSKDLLSRTTKLSSPLNEFEVITDIEISAFRGAEVVPPEQFATLGLIRQTFSQTVPEPSTWLLLGSGLAGMILWRKRTAQRVRRTL